MSRSRFFITFICVQGISNNNFLMHNITFTIHDICYMIKRTSSIPFIEPTTV